MLFRRVFVCFLVTFLLIGCVGSKLHRLDIEGNEIQQQWLDLLEDGKTTKEEVLLRFGIPSAQFEGERILTYRMVLDKKEGNSKEGTLVVVSRELDPRQVFKMWRIAQYDLVLVFDEGGVLEKHSLIQVR